MASTSLVTWSDLTGASTLYASTPQDCAAIVASPNSPSKLELSVLERSCPGRPFNARALTQGHI